MSIDSNKWVACSFSSGVVRTWMRANSVIITSLILRMKYFITILDSRIDLVLDYPG